MILTRAQMGLYKIDDEGRHRESYDRYSDWELDEPGGCPWCGEFPDDLLELVSSIREQVAVDYAQTR